MVVPSFNTLQTYNGGQMTDLPTFAGPFDGTELFEVVAPGNVEEGINYSIPSLLLAQYIAGLIAGPTIITVGATIGSPYAALGTDTRILLNKTTPSASYVNIGAATDRKLLPVMVRDLAGNADTFNISISFTGIADGIASPIVISNPYAGWVFNPLPNGNWFLTNT